MQYNFKVVNDKMVCDKREMPLTGNVNTYRCVFDIECDIENLLWFCVFERDGKAYVQPILENECFIPREVLVSEGKIKIGCYATNLKEDDFKRISTNWVFFNSLEGAYSDAAMPEVPEPDVWEELVLKSVPIIGENGNWFIYDITKMQYVDSGVKASGKDGADGKDGKNGVDGKNGLDGKDGEDGYTPVKGVDYYTPEDKAEIVDDVAEVVTPNEFELIASGETTEEVNSIIITQDNDGNPFELCDMVNIYICCPKTNNTSNQGLDVLVGGVGFKTHASVLSTAGKRYAEVRAVYTGAVWDFYQAHTDLGTAAMYANPYTAYTSIVNNGQILNSVKQIKLFIYNTAHKIPAGFKYYIYGRRVKNANT